MPIYKSTVPDLAAGGPSIQVAIGPSRELIAAFAASGMELASPYPAAALIDTGAHTTVLAPDLVSRLNIQPVGKAPISTPSYFLNRVRSVSRERLFRGGLCRREHLRHRGPDGWRSLPMPHRPGSLAVRNALLQRARRQIHVEVFVRRTASLSHLTASRSRRRCRGRHEEERPASARKRLNS